MVTCNTGRTCAACRGCRDGGGTRRCPSTCRLKPLLLRPGLACARSRQAVGGAPGASVARAAPPQRPSTAAPRTRRGGLRCTVGWKPERRFEAGAGGGGGAGGGRAAELRLGGRRGAGGAAMNAAVVKRTQEALGKVIRRPPLTEKLLNKPPFRYLHDIITEVGARPRPGCGPGVGAHGGGRGRGVGRELGSRCGPGVRAHGGGRGRDAGRGFGPGCEFGVMVGVLAGGPRPGVSLGSGCGPGFRA